MLVALKPLHDAANHQANCGFPPTSPVSGAGNAAMDELFPSKHGRFFVNDPVEPEHFTKQIAFNVIPHIDIFMDDGYTKEEWKTEGRKRTRCLTRNIKVTATAVRVPVFIGHAEAINIEFKDEITEDQARETAAQCTGLPGNR